VEFVIAMAGVIVRQAEGSLRAARAAWKDAQRPSTVRHYSRAPEGGSNRGERGIGKVHRIPLAELLCMSGKRRGELVICLGRK